MKIHKVRERKQLIMCNRITRQLRKKQNEKKTHFMISDTRHLCILATSSYHGDGVGNGYNISWWHQLIMVLLIKMRSNKDEIHVSLIFWIIIVIFVLSLSVPLTLAVLQGVLRQSVPLMVSSFSVSCSRTLQQERRLVTQQGTTVIYQETVPCS